MEKVLVAAAVIRKGNSVLICRRPRSKRHGGLWEFPGGKLHSGETLEDALRRELWEELGVELISTGATLFATQDPGSPFEVHFVETKVAGDPSALEHEEVIWVPVNDCQRFALAPSDRAFVERYLMPEPLHS